jgi:hypothetical protein
MGSTPWVETEILVAVMSGDRDEALRLLGTMLPGERAALEEYIDTLADLIDQHRIGAR